MKDIKDNIIVVKSTEFAVEIVKACNWLRKEKKEWVMSEQLLKSGTSIGANIREGIRGQSSADFYAKFNVSLKEASETDYWLELLFLSGYFDKTLYDDLNLKCQELIRLLMSIVKHKDTPKKL
jgi:four helix bundle protein